MWGIMYRTDVIIRKISPDRNRRIVLKGLIFPIITAVLYIISYITGLSHGLPNIHGNCKVFQVPARFSLSSVSLNRSHQTVLTGS